MPFFQKLPALKLATFPSLQRRMKSTQKQSKASKADRTMFARLLVVAQTRGMDMRAVLEFNLGPLPLALATLDGSLTKTNKAKLLSLLEADVPPLVSVPANAVWIVDGMAILQSISRPPATFELLAGLVFQMATQSLQHGGSRVDFVSDQYPDISIKAIEWRRRQHGDSMCLNVVRGD